MCTGAPPFIPSRVALHRQGTGDSRSHDYASTRTIQRPRLARPSEGHWLSMARAAVLGRLTWRPGQALTVPEETPSAQTLPLDAPDWDGHQPGQHVDIHLTAAATPPCGRHRGGRLAYRGRPWPARPPEPASRLRYGSPTGQRRAASPARPAVAAGDDDPVAIQVEHLAGGLGPTLNANRFAP